LDLSGFLADTLCCKEIPWLRAMELVLVFLSGLVIKKVYPAYVFHFI
jgi:hypothetical protein